MTARVRGWSPALVAISLVGPVVTLFLGWLVASNHMNYLWRDELARPYPRPLADFILVHVPAALGIAAIFLLSAPLAYRRRQMPGASRRGLALASLVGLGGSILVAAVLHQAAFPSPARTRPLATAANAFTEDQWDQALEYADSIRPEWRRPMVFVPFDPLVLDRVTFVGLTLSEVYRALAPGATEFRFAHTFHLSLPMVPPRRCEKASLDLRYEYNARMELEVTQETVRKGDPCQVRY